MDEKEILRLQKELNRWENKYKKLQQVFRLQEEIIATYEAAYGEAPGLIEEEMQEKESKENNSFFKMMEKRSYNRFNQEQKAAITYDMQKHLRIIAGAGSGKTQTICAKAVYLMTQKQVDEERILMITFTRNAANELKKRVDNFSQRKTAVHIGTFHSIFFRIYNEICRKFPDVAMQGIQGDFSKDTAQKVNAVLQQLIRKYNLYLFDQYGEKTIASRLDYWQNMNLSIEEMIQLVKEKYDSIDKNTRQPISERLYGLLTELQEQKRRQQLLEFNDVLQNLKSALENDEIQRYIGQKYDYLFIDEFQDTNPLQWEIVKRMTKENGIKLIVVGDDDQSIYGFRGSEPAYIKNFEKEYPTKTLFLLTNYRSRAAIVQGANRLISYNKNDRIPKAMIPAQKEAGIMEAYLFSDTKAESQWLISQIQSFIQKNGKYKESIILYRSASQTQQLVQSLLKTNIPFVLEADSPYEGIFGIKFFQQFYQKIVHWQTAQNPQKKNQAYQQLLRQLMVDCYLKKSEGDQYFSPKYQNTAITDYILSVRPNLKSKSAEIRQFEEALRKTDQHQEIYSLVQSYLHLPRIAKEIDQSDQEWIREEVKQHATFRSIQALSQETQATAKELKTRLIAYRQGKLDALCIQSIHKSKGLSYRNVFLIGCNEGSLPYNGATEKKVIDSNEIKAEPATTIEEERRLFYVAMTRARNRLYLCVPQMKNTRKLKVSRFVKETGSRMKKGK
ncbi:ATP-dependent helicase [Enterococcus faecium]|uniref:ATP-dependent helicase n=1 Tax=Enterococcus lactis TaxID=357441 RepID=UPI0019EC853F|nr:ATP-dependent helicase [Enterococcus lactis]EGP5280205.1 ATP-dependent helicase [Enterococcus faecium]EGP5412369.1 ATP-dependent helicase [Enterococcus faecium]EME7168852.1 ATP-dependent helicase [Enterococcus faecium]EMF0549329.1 ATP-dependent helicase [Enterococcus faecium]NTL92517.1 ATP-dependent helicase [Enterococcus faecium]